MKRIIIGLLCLISLNIQAQEDKTVTLVVSGQGKTQDEAKQNALRSAIEQAFGTFISTKTEILNDSLIKDEIISVANGNIQKFEIISEVQTPSGLFASTINATVSVTRLTSFVEGKGVEVEFKGGLFGANIRQQKLNEISEEKAINNICEVSWDFIIKSFDYEVVVNQPISDNQTSKFKLTFDIYFKKNNNFSAFLDYLDKNLSSLSPNLAERQIYKNLNKTLYTIEFAFDDDYKIFYLRSPNSLAMLKNLFIKSHKAIDNFRIYSNLDTFDLYTPENIARTGRYPSMGKFIEFYYPLNLSSIAVLEVVADGYSLSKIYNEITGDFFDKRNNYQKAFCDRHEMFQYLGWELNPQNSEFYAITQSENLIVSMNKNINNKMNIERLYNLETLEKIENFKIAPINSQEFFNMQ